MLKINRRPGTQDVSWFLDQHRYRRLDVDPPYQRRSVWTSKDRRYFLDTLFRGFPCPPVYLHKTIDASGTATFHVVDGKQRIETIIRFADNKLRIPDNYGDERFNNKRWKDIIGDTELRNRFLNYPFVVEYFDDVDGSVVNEIFERMNKNSRRLTQQELRNARYDGWFSSEVESEVDEAVWRHLGIATPGRARRMADMQFIAELFMVIIDKKIVGFDHNQIDLTYANYEDPENPDLDFDLSGFKDDLASARKRLTAIHTHDPHASKYLSSVSNMYSLWGFLVLENGGGLDDEELARRYIAFMTAVDTYGAQLKEAPGSAEASTTATAGTSEAVAEYYNANQSATTEYPQRAQRLNALRKGLTA